jgi:RNA polymerase sigma factor (sigma-70 family)
MEAMSTAQLDPILRHLRKLVAGRDLHEWSDRQLLDDFAARREEAAFAVLLARHGPMVLRVCRRVLGHEQDAEDAFQATFLVLAGNTASIRKREALADWLHGVAYRTAMKAKRGAARRRTREAHVRAAAPTSSAGPTWNEVQAALDEELRNLPEPFRLAFVLCVLEGKSGPEAAALLGCKEGTVSSRLTRARQQLRRQLIRRGINLASLIAVLAVAESAGRAAVSTPLAEATMRFGLLVAAGESVAGVIPTQVAALAAGVTRAMFLTKTKILTVALLVFAALATAAGALTLAGALADEGAKPVKEATNAKPPADEGKPADNATLSYSGRVLDPDGKPVAGTKVSLALSWGYLQRAAPSPVYATSGADGRFQFTAPKAPFDRKHTSVVVTADGFGPGWLDVDTREKNEDLTVQLVKDEVPITGQVVELQGKPVAGAAVRVLEIMAAPKEDLGPWLKAVTVAKGQGLRLEYEYLSRRLKTAEVPALPQKVTTDADGKFRLTGIGRDRLVTVCIDGPAIASQVLRVLTRVGKTLVVPEVDGMPQFGIPRLHTTYHGAAFQHVAGPTKPIVGVVRDRDTKKPLAGVKIKSYKLANNPMHGLDFLETTTDEQGRYQLNGMPKGTDNKILLLPRDDQPYLPAHALVPDSPGFDPVTVNFDVKRGVWIEGKLTDQATGKPVQGQLQYFAMLNNPHLRDHPEFDGTFLNQRTASAGEDGRFRVVGLPGPGLLSVSLGDQYLLANERDDADGAKGGLGTAPFHIFAGSANALARINPDKDAELFQRDVKVDPGVTLTGTLVGPDGKPVEGVLSSGLTSSHGWERPPLATASFTVRAFNPRQPRPVLFRHVEKGLVGVLEPPKNVSKPVTVRLQPGATATGRLVDADGQPRANVELDISIRARHDEWDAYSLPGKIKTDAVGRFRIDTLLPGYQFELYDRQGKYHFGDDLRPGETKELGDVQLKQAAE